MASHHLIFSLLFLTLTPLFALAAKHPVRLHFYLHKTVNTSYPDAAEVVKGSIPVPGSIFNFGSIVVIDAPITLKPRRTSTFLGRAQGFYIVMKTITVEWTLNIIFSNGKYKGSTLAILGRDELALRARELAIVGGSGAFRMAQGYLRIKTYSVNFTTGDAELEIDAYVYPRKKY